MNKDSPIFVIGNPRSGTTLLRLILTSHPDIVIPPESAFLIWLEEKYRDWTSDLLNKKLDYYLNDLFNCKKFDTWRLDRKKLKSYIQQSSPGDYASLSSLIYKFYAIKMGRKAKRWGDKNNWYLNYIGLIKKLYKDTFFVHIVRDGRDVACSYKELNDAKINHIYAPKLPNKIKDIASDWVNNLKTINQSFKNIGWENVLEIRYEDLIENPEKVIKKICRCVGVKYYKNMLNFYKFNKKMKLEPESFMKWKKRTLNKIDNKTVGKYKRFLTKKEINQFEGLCSTTLLHYGYV